MFPKINWHCQSLARKDIVPRNGSSRAAVEWVSPHGTLARRPNCGGADTDWTMCVYVLNICIFRYIYTLACASVPRRWRGGRMAVVRTRRGRCVYMYSMYVDIDIDIYIYIYTYR